MLVRVGPLMFDKIRIIVGLPNEYAKVRKEKEQPARIN